MPLLRLQARTLHRSGTVQTEEPDLGGSVAQALLDSGAKGDDAMLVEAELRQIEERLDGFCAALKRLDQASDPSASWEFNLLPEKFDAVNQDMRLLIEQARALRAKAEKAKAVPSDQESWAWE
jgi:hypothetical protein